MDESNQTFPVGGENAWFVYDTEEQIDTVIDAMSEKGLREHSLKQNLMNVRDKIVEDLLGCHEAILKTENGVKLEPIASNGVADKPIKSENNGTVDIKSNLSTNTTCIQESEIKTEEKEDLEDKFDYCNEMFASLKEDIMQIERELIEGSLGSVDDFDSWSKPMLDTADVSVLARQLVQAQRCMRLRGLKGFMAPLRKATVEGAADAPAEEGVEAKPHVTEYVAVEGSGVLKWREAVLSCRTYSRLHVLVGMFDSCIRWEKSLQGKVGKCKCPISHLRLRKGLFLYHNVIDYYYLFLYSSRGT